MKRNTDLQETAIILANITVSDKREKCYRHSERTDIQKLVVEKRLSAKLYKPYLKKRKGRVSWS